mmetsp:Transcript_23862/g.62715  ORF Transcript_23862/g.62715 Transcript_23862/m.62715 type:complete len:82 (+) Transcript_23862:381-626(+)
MRMVVFGAPTNSTMSSRQGIAALWTSATHASTCCPWDTQRPHRAHGSLNSLSEVLGCADHVHGVPNAGLSLGLRHYNNLQK